MADFTFRLPLEIDLTDTQRIALDYEESLVVCGGPGSGKTVVTIFKFLEPINDGVDAMLFTYNKTLQASIKGILRSEADTLFENIDPEEVEGIISSSIMSFSKYYGDINYSDESEVESRFNQLIMVRGSEKFDEIFFDEAQDLTPAVFSKAHLLSDKISCGADDAQNLQGNFRPDEAVTTIYKSLLIQNNVFLQELQSNFRNSRQIFEFARNFVPEDENVQNIDITDLNIGENPEVREHQNETAQLNTIKNIIENNLSSNIGILVNYTNQVDDVKEFLEANGYSCEENAPENLSFSYYKYNISHAHERIMNDRLKTPFILTYDSCKGLEFDIVIMPFFNDAENALNKQRYSRDGGTKVYHYNIDGTPKMWGTRNHYYVGATRARYQLFLLCNERPDILNF